MGESVLSALEIVVKTADITEEDYGGVWYIKGNIGATHQTKASLLEPSNFILKSANGATTNPFLNCVQN